MIVKDLSGKLFCPFCCDPMYNVENDNFDFRPVQPMYTYAEDIDPKQTRLYCPHCDFEITISDIYPSIHESN